MGHHGGGRAVLFVLGTLSLALVVGTSVAPAAGGNATLTGNDSVTDTNVELPVSLPEEVTVDSSNTTGDVDEPPPKPDPGEVAPKPPVDQSPPTIDDVKTVTRSLDVDRLRRVQNPSLGGLACIRCTEPAADDPSPRHVSPTRTPTPTPAACTACDASRSESSQVFDFLGPSIGVGLIRSWLELGANLLAALTPLTVSFTHRTLGAAVVLAVRDAPVTPATPFYSRSDGSDPLEHEDRQALVDLARQRPGLTLSDVRKRLEIPRSTLRYHVRILEEESELTTQHVLGRKRLFPARMEASCAVVAALRDPGTQRVLQALARVEPAPSSRLVDELGKSPSTVSYHLERLEDTGVVSRERTDNQTINCLTPAARAVLGTDDEERDDRAMQDRGRISN